MLIKLEINNDSTKRWERQLDRKAFKYLSKELVKIGMNLNSFLLDYPIEMISHMNKWVKWEFRNVLLKKVALQFGWHKTTYFLFKRLRKLTKNQTFSFRELKLLKRVQN